MPTGLSGKRKSQLSPIQVKNFNTPGKVRNHQQLHASQVNGLMGRVPNAGSVSIPGTQKVGGYGGAYAGLGAGKKSAGLLNSIAAEPANEIELPDSLGECRSSYQFMVASMAAAFEIQSSQAAKMMTGNNKSLLTICINGNTGADYSRV